MSAIAEPVPHAMTDDRLARRNALVLAVAQALRRRQQHRDRLHRRHHRRHAGADKGLATLPISSMVIGMWLGTLPVGVLARRFGRRFALQIGSVFGMLSGLISYSAVMQGTFWLLFVGTFCGGLYAAAHQSYRFAAADTASDALPAEGDLLGAGRRRVRRRDRPAAHHLHQGHAGAASVRGELSRPIGLRGAGGHRAAIRQDPAAAAHKHAGGSGAAAAGDRAQPRFIVAVACGIASYAMMNW